MIDKVRLGKHMTQQYESDEIDLFELAETLWRGKFIIILCTVFALGFGLGFLNFQTKKYTVPIPYTVGIYSVTDQQICEFNRDCLSTTTLSYASNALGSDWSLNTKSKRFEMSTTAPQSIAEYMETARAASEAVTLQTKIDTENELNAISSIGTPDMLGTKRIATNILNAKRIIIALENGAHAISFANVSITQAQKTNLVLALSIVLGAFLGASAVLLRAAIANRRNATC